MEYTAIVPTFIFQMNNAKTLVINQAIGNARLADQFQRVRPNRSGRGRPA